MLGFLLLCFSSLFSIVNPLSSAVVFEAISTKYTNKEKLDIIRRSALTMMFVLIIFSLTGLVILKFFSITLDALRIGGGLYLMLISFRMLNPTRSHKEIHPKTKSELKYKDDIAIAPIAIPLLSGPGAITTTIVLSTQNPTYYGLLTLIAVILIITILTYFILKNADWLTKRFLGHTGIKTLEKIMGLIILCIGVQFILNGMKDYLMVVLQAL